MRFNSQKHNLRQWVFCDDPKKRRRKESTHLLRLINAEYTDTMIHRNSDYKLAICDNTRVRSTIDTHLLRSLNARHVLTRRGRYISLVIKEKMNHHVCTLSFRLYNMILHDKCLVSFFCLPSIIIKCSLMQIIFLQIEFIRATQLYYKFCITLYYSFNDRFEY